MDNTVLFLGFIYVVKSFRSRGRVGPNTAMHAAPAEENETNKQTKPVYMYWLTDDRLYNAVLRSLEQTHCARMWFYMSD